MAKGIVTRDLVDLYLEPYYKVTSPIFDSEMGQRLHYARKKMELSQIEMAKQLGLSQPTLSRLENGTLEHCGLPVHKFKEELKEHFAYFIVGDGYWKYEEIKVRWDRRLRRNVYSR